MIVYSCHAEEEPIYTDSREVTLLLVDHDTTTILFHPSLTPQEVQALGVAQLSEDCPSLRVDVYHPIPKYQLDQVPPLGRERPIYPVFVLR